MRMLCVFFRNLPKLPFMNTCVTRPARTSHSGSAIFSGATLVDMGLDGGRRFELSREDFEETSSLFRKSKSSYRSLLPNFFTNVDSSDCCFRLRSEPSSVC